MLLILFAGQSDRRGIEHSTLSLSVTEIGVVIFMGQLEDAELLWLARV